MKISVTKYLKLRKKLQSSKLIIFFLLIALIVISCKENKTILNENTINFSEFPKNENIYFNDIVEYNKGNPAKLHLVDSTLIIFNSSHNIKYFLYNYSLIKNQFSNGYLRKGRGPSEALGAFSSGIIGNKLWVYDITLKKIMIIDKKRALTDNMYLSFEEFPVKDIHYSIDFVNNHTILGTGNEQSGFKVDEVDLLSGNITNEFGEFKSLEDIPFEAIKDAYLPYIFCKPSGGQAVLPYRYSDILEIYNLNNKTNISVQGPVGFDVDFNVGTRQGRSYMKKNKKTRKAFVNGKVTDKFIYLLYSGNLRSDKNWSYGKQIYVYDWLGKPIKKIVLDRYIYTFEVSDDDKTLYSYDINSGYIIQANLN